MYTRIPSNDRTLARRVRHVDLDGGDAFVPDFRRGFVPVKDGDAEAFGEEFIAAATSAEAMGEAARDELIDEDLGGLTLEMSFDEVAEDYFEPADRKAS
ncbi:MAG: hypothetical protein JWP87_6305 [Labilithrix sp.]|jgi:hypothetical protein|nr:hypothetical protein [Labilithrix sp.]